MKIAVLDVDQIHNQRLRTILASNDKIDLVVCDSLTELLEVLNGNQTIELKKQLMEKTLAEGKAMLARTSAALEKAKLNEVVQQAQIASANVSAQKPLLQNLLNELASNRSAIAKTEDLISKLTRAIAAKEADIAGLTSQILTEEQKKVHLLLVDRSQLGNIPSGWTVGFRKQITLPANQEVPVAAMGYNEDIDYIKKTVHGGVVDYFVKPVDALLLKHNVGRLTEGKVTSEDKMFTLVAQAEIQIFKTASIVSMSEFELTLQTDTSFRPKEIVEFYARNFTVEFSKEKGQRLLGCCDQLDLNPKGGFLARFSFVGHTPKTMNEMRKWLRTQYILIKQKQREKE